MRSIEWYCCRWPWMTPYPENHPNFYTLRCLAYLCSAWVNIKTWYTGWLWQFPVYGRQTVPERGVVTSRDSFGVQFISQEWLKLKLSNFVHRQAISSLNKGMIHHPPQRVVVMVTYTFNFLVSCNILERLKLDFKFSLLFRYVTY